MSARTRIEEARALLAEAPRGTDDTTVLRALSHLALAVDLAVTVEELVAICDLARDAADLAWGMGFSAEQQLRLARRTR